MRLINTTTHLIEKFDDPSNAPSSGYAILSHTWALKPDKELELENIRAAGDDVAKATLAQQNLKIREACKLAQAQTPAISHAWIDTICIDQNSSSDKSEAINAMYRYYQDAKICFTYLFEVDGRGILLTDSNPNQPDTADVQAVRKEFTDARWFKRGWTLQELLAPPQLFFYDKNWNLLGSRNELCNTIAGITRIEPGVLQDARQMWACSVAKRMSWAAGRETRRPEDRAYSLLGIFGLNMPMLYGEGDRAFIRLQEEIIRISDDHSLFAWSLSEDQNNSALLARSPDAFRGCTNITQVLYRTGNKPYTVNNRGISIELNLFCRSTDVYVAPINCARQPTQQPLGGPRKPLQLGIFLKKQEEDDKFIRVSLQGKDFYEFPLSGEANPNNPKHPRLNESTVHIKRDPGPLNVSSPGAVLNTINGFKIGPSLLRACGKTPAWKPTRHSSWDPAQQIVFFTVPDVPSLDLTNSYLKVSHPEIEDDEIPLKVRFLYTYDLECDFKAQGALNYYDANKEREVLLDLHRDFSDDPYTYQSVQVDRRDGLNAYFKNLTIDDKEFLHVMLQRERISTENSEVWVLDVEIVKDFKGNPWA